MPATLCILGASGDLTSRLLLPGLGTLLARDEGREVNIVGADAHEVPEADWRDRVTSAFAANGVAQGSDAYQSAAQSRWFTTDITDADAFGKLLAECRDAEPLVLYFALPPAITKLAVDTLRRIGIPDGTQLAFEKPFGGDLDGARSLNAKLRTLAPESCIHRVDHFLGTSTVLNLISLRFANRLVQRVWSAEDIESIEIVFDEELTLEGRAGYYDRAGALVDMIQSHLLQVMAFVTMKAPSRIDATELRDVTSQALRATWPWRGDPAAASHRARYTAGAISGQQVPDYVDEPGVDPSHETETLTQVTVEVRNSDWAGVPITLRSGKAIGEPSRAVHITFREVRCLPLGLDGTDSPDQLVINLDPDRLELHLTTNTADDALGLKQAVLQTNLRQSALLPYGEVLAGILDGDPMLTVRGDAAEECWRITEAFQRAATSGAVPLQTYPAGSQGPEGWGSPMGRAQ